MSRMVVSHTYTSTGFVDSKMLSKFLASISFQLISVLLVRFMRGGRWFNDCIELGRSAGFIVDEDERGG